MVLGSRLLGAGLVGAFAVLGVSCGDPDESLTKEEFIAQADAICATSVAEMDLLLEEFWTGFDEPDGDATEAAMLAGLAEVMHDVEPVMDAQLAELRDLVPPAGDQELIDALIDDQQTAVDEFADTVRAAAEGDVAAQQAMNSDEDPFAEIDRRARAYGLMVCGDPGNSDPAEPSTALPPTPARTSDRGPLRLGLAYGLTDPGLESLTARAILAVETVAAIAESVGIDVEVIIEDTAGDPVQGVDAANKLVAAGAHCILGEIRSAVTATIVAVSAEARVPQISGGSTAPALTTIDDDDFFFRTVLSDAAQGVVAGNYVFEELVAHTAVIVVQNDPYGLGLGAAFASQYEAVGGEVLQTIAIDTGTVDLSAEVEAIAGDDPDAIYTVLFGPEFIPFVLELDHSAPAMIDRMFLADAQSTINASHGIEDLVAGVSGLRPAAADLTQFSDYFETVSGQAAAPFSEFNYDATVLCIAAATAADSYDGVAIRDELRDVSTGGDPYRFDQFDQMLHAILAGDDVDYVGAGSTLDFDDHGDVNPTGTTYLVWTYATDGTIIHGEQITYTE